MLFLFYPNDSLLQNKTMVESLVQWTLLNNLSELGQNLDFDISSVIGQEITTEYGRIVGSFEDVFLGSHFLVRNKYLL